MDNIRVYDAAKELGLTNKEMIEQLETKIGVKVKSHSSTLTLSQFERFKEVIKKPTNAAPKKPKAFIVKKVKSTNDSTKTQVTVEEIKPEEKKTVVHHEKAETKPEVKEEKKAEVKTPEKKPEENKNSSENDLLSLLFYRSYVACASAPLSVMLCMPSPKGAR